MNSIPSSVLCPPLLLATDGSASAQAAQPLLVAIARQLAADPTQSFRDRAPQVTVLTVRPRRSRRGEGSRSRATASSNRSDRPPSATPKALTPDIAQAEETVEPWFAAMQTSFPSDFQVELQVRRGRPATEILTYARTVKAGLIAVGQRGTGGMRERWLGSVSAVIARYAPCSVLVARGRSHPAACLNHVLLVVDDRTSTHAAIALTRQLAPAGIQQITLLVAQSPLNANYLFGPFATPTPSWQLNQSLQEVQKEQSEQVLQQAKQALNLPNLDVQMVSQTSESGPLICQMAQQRQVDLIILGSETRRRSLLTSLPHLHRGKSDASTQALRNTRLSPSDDYTIHHAPCPVLLCRSEALI